MKFKLKPGYPPYSTTYGGVTYKLTADKYTELPPALASLFATMLVAEAEPEPKKEKEVK
jgi:hypothetical protein